MRAAEGLETLPVAETLRVLQRRVGGEVSEIAEGSPRAAQARPEPSQLPSPMGLYANAEFEDLVDDDLLLPGMPPLYDLPEPPHPPPLPSTLFGPTGSAESRS